MVSLYYWPGHNFLCFNSVTASHALRRLCHGFSCSNSVTISHPLPLSQLLTLYLCHSFSRSTSAMTSHTLPLSRLLTLYLCHGFSCSCHYKNISPSLLIFHDPFHFLTVFHYLFIFLPIFFFILSFPSYIYVLLSPSTNKHVSSLNYNCHYCLGHKFVLFSQKCI